jgi:hypothetical protein
MPTHSSRLTDNPMTNPRGAFISLSPFSQQTHERLLNLFFAHIAVLRHEAVRAQEHWPLAPLARLTPAQAAGRGTTRVVGHDVTHSPLRWRA